MKSKRTGSSKSTSKEKVPRPLQDDTELVYQVSTATSNVLSSFGPHEWREVSAVKPEKLGPVRKLTKHILTDWDNLTYDTGRVLGVVALGTAIFLAGWTVIVLKIPFDAVAFLGGTGGFLTGLGIYLYGDGKSRPTTTIKE